MPVRPRSLRRPARAGGVWRHWAVWIYFPAALGLSLAGVCLWKSGNWLVTDDPFERMAWTGVLAGESRDCERTDAALKLQLEGRIDTVVLSGTRVFKTRYTSEFMSEYAVQNGYPRGKVFEFRHDTYSTLEEARQLIRQFRLQNLDTVLIITSNFHTARTRRTFRKLAQGFPHVLVYSAEYHAYDPGAWWSSRESRKIWLSEWAKTLYSFYELTKAPPENGKSEFQNLIPDIWTVPQGGGGRGGAKADTVMGRRSEPMPESAAPDTGQPGGMKAPAAADSLLAAVPPDTLRNDADTSAVASKAGKDTLAAKALAKESMKASAHKVEKLEKLETAKAARESTKKALERTPDKAKAKKKAK